MSVLLDELGALLDAGGVGVLGTSLFLGRMPDTPDNAVAVREYPGSAPRYSHSGLTEELSRVQIMSRSTDPVVAESAARVAWELLAASFNRTAGAVYILSAVPIQSPFDLGRDERDRPTYAFNAEIRRRR